MIMLKSTHARALTEMHKNFIQACEDNEACHTAFVVKLKANHDYHIAQLRATNLALQNENSGLRGKLVHVMDNPEHAVIATSGTRKPK